MTKQKPTEVGITVACDLRPVKRFGDTLS